MTPQEKKLKREAEKEENLEAYLERSRRANLKHFFGITLEEYNEMLESQNGLCAICQRHHTEFKRNLAVDHDHHTGKIRGLLCGSCNSGLGKLQDDMDVLECAIVYLEKHSAYPSRLRV